MGLEETVEEVKTQNQKFREFYQSKVACNTGSGKFFRIYVKQAENNMVCRYRNTRSY